LNLVKLKGQPQGWPFLIVWHSRPRLCSPSSYRLQTALFADGTMKFNMNRETFIQALVSAVPGFKPDSDWVAESLCYPVVNDLARYVCEEADRDGDGVESALKFLETALSQGDLYIRDLVHECFDTLDSCGKISEIKKHFGPQTLALWNQFFEKN
jgi:hypothetical protein